MLLAYNAYSCCNINPAEFFNSLLFLLLEKDNVVHLGGDSDLVGHPGDLVHSFGFDPGGTWRDWKFAPVILKINEQAVWEENFQMIQDHNKQADLGKYTYRLGMNHFGDLTNEELQKRLHCLLSASDNVTKGNGIIFKSSDDPDIPDQVDWRIKGAVTRVKDQGDCGSCWAFSATGALEGMHFKKTGKLVSLSEQNLIDCCEENYGCEGGFMERAFETVRKQGGINSEKSYPYDRWLNCFALWDEKALQEAVAKIGPVSVGIDAGNSKFGFYKSGIYTEDYEGERIINHAVVMVGYNHSSNGNGYWIVKNSWSTLWGEKGYMRLAKGSNECHIADYAVFPLPDPRKGM
uniref:Cathepsin L n=1 Tax=Naja naja TaxID=35670 RepID=A0A8C6X289_NAJNA